VAGGESGAEGVGPRGGKIKDGERGRCGREVGAGSGGRVGAGDGEASPLEKDGEPAKGDWVAIAAEHARAGREAGWERGRRGLACRGDAFDSEGEDKRGALAWLALDADAAGPGRCRRIYAWWRRQLGRKA